MSSETIRVHYLVRIDEGEHKTDMAKFFDRTHAADHKASLGMAGNDLEVEEREEPAGDQHPAHADDVATRARVYVNEMKAAEALRASRANEAS